MNEILMQAVIYLFAAVVAVPLASRLGLGSVLGYLLAGIVIGPVFNLVGSETTDIQHFAEFGVVMMLFLVGLELEPRALWAMRGKLLGLGGLQVSLTTLAVMGIAMFLGQPWRYALAIGLIFALSSTAIVLQTLNEKGLMKSKGGESGFSVLLFQDIAVIPMLALVPLLASPELLDIAHGAGDDGHGSTSLIDGLPGWQATLVIFGAVAAVVVGGHYLIRPIFRYISQAGLREMFTATALLLVIAIALLMSLCGLSPALGTFLAGVVLATSEYRHELESDIDPFKGLLLGLFFITVGAGIDFGILFDNLVVILSLTIGLMLLKSLVLLVLALVFKLEGSDRWLFALSLAQAGEFGFVLLSFTVQNGVLPAGLAQTLLLVVTLSMLLTPGLFILLDKVVFPRLAGAQRDPDEIDDTGSVIIAGIGRFGQIINRVLIGNGYKTTVLDLRTDTIDTLAVFGIKSFFGDASRPDLLHAAGLKEARMIVVAIDDRERSVDIVKHVRRERPDIHIVARAVERHHVYDLYQAGADDIIRDTFDSACRAARSALEALDCHPYEAQRIIDTFIDSDRNVLLRMASLYDPEIPPQENQAYVQAIKDIRAETDDNMSGILKSDLDKLERAWQPPPAGASST